MCTMTLSVENLSSRDWDILFWLHFLSFCSVPLKVSSHSRVARPPKSIWQIHPTHSAGTSNLRNRGDKSLPSKLFYKIAEPWSIWAGSWDKKCKNWNRWQSKVIWPWSGLKAEGEGESCESLLGELLRCDQDAGAKGLFCVPVHGLSPLPRLEWMGQVLSHKTSGSTACPSHSSWLLSVKLSHTDSWP